MNGATKHGSDVRVRVDTKHGDSTPNPSGVVPEIFVAGKDDTITWEVHDPDVADFTVDFDPEYPFAGGNKFTKASPKSGKVKSPGLPSPNQHKYVKYTLTITPRTGSPKVIDPGGIIMGP